jgi:hypothetical protein
VRGGSRLFEWTFARFYPIFEVDKLKFFTLQFKVT